MPAVMLAFSIKKITIFRRDDGVISIYNEFIIMIGGALRSPFFYFLYLSKSSIVLMIRLQLGHKA